MLGLLCGLKMAVQGFMRWLLCQRPLHPPLWEAVPQYIKPVFGAKQIGRIGLTLPAYDTLLPHPAFVTHLSIGGKLESKSKIVTFIF
jgi:hypothetical protein